MTNDLFRDLTAAVFCYNNNAALAPPLLSVALAGLQLRGVLLRYRSPAPDRDARLKQTPLISGISWIQSEGVSASFTDRHPAALSSLQARWRKIKAPEGRL